MCAVVHRDTSPWPLCISLNIILRGHCSSFHMIVWDTVCYYRATISFTLSYMYAHTTWICHQILPVIQIFPHFTFLDPLPATKACCHLWRVELMHIRKTKLCFPISCDGSCACPIFQVESNNFVEWGTDGVGPTCVCSPVSRAPQVQPSPSDCRGWGGTSSPPPSSSLWPSSKSPASELYAFRPPQFGDASFPIPIEPFAAAIQLSLVKSEWD